MLNDFKEIFSTLFLVINLWIFFSKLVTVNNHLRFLWLSFHHRNVQSKVWNLSSGVEDMLFYAITDGKEQVPFSHFISVSIRSMYVHAVFTVAFISQCFHDFEMYLFLLFSRPSRKLAFTRLTLAWNTVWTNFGRRVENLLERWWWTESSSTGTTVEVTDSYRL